MKGVGVMRDFVEVKIVYANQIDDYLKDGWEIIDTTTLVLGNGESKLEYHIGLPPKAKIDQLKQIIKLYEEYGFKEELFKKIAEKNGHDLNDYTEGSGFHVNNETTQFIENYEKIVNNKVIKLYKKFDLKEL
jgi:alanyl-tRNA synthetase